MQTYIALLRGINVSGKNKILMKDLKILFEDLAFSEVKTYIQSGNVIFKTAISSALLPELISNKIKEDFQLTVPVIIRTFEEIKNIISETPYFGEENTKKLYVGFLSEIPLNTTKLDAFDFGNDDYKIVKNTIYLKYDLGAGRSKLSIKMIENKLGITATARNWRTTNKLLELSS